MISGPRGLAGPSCLLLDLEGAISFRVLGERVVDGIISVTGGANPHSTPAPKERHNLARDVSPG
jgi:hypothetical protein